MPPSETDGGGGGNWTRVQKSVEEADYVRSSRLSPEGRAIQVSKPEESPVLFLRDLPAGSREHFYKCSSLFADMLLSEASVLNGY